VLVNVCPAATTKAPPDIVWSLIASPERWDKWTDAVFVSASPPGPARSGQVIRFAGRALARNWTFTIDVRDLDPQHRWIDLVAHFPFGIDLDEHLTLTETKEGGTLVRFN
jgi:Polyketide cyclase / dehydrase and lipid transport